MTKQGPSRRIGLNKRVACGGLLPPVISVITITGIGDHLQPEWLITFTGTRTHRP